MADKKDLKRKAPMDEYDIYTLEDAFNMGREVTTEHYRNKLKIYKNLNDAIDRKYLLEREVHILQGKLEILHDLFKEDAMIELKQKLEFELVLAEAKVTDLKLPYVDWKQLNEPQMYE